MSDISFYEITAEEYEKVICLILEKCYETGKNTLAKFKDKEMAEVYNKLLWSFKRRAFIPHGTIYDEKPELQPILLSSEGDNLNNSDILFLFNAEQEKISDFDKVIIAFLQDSNSDKARCRELYANYKRQGHNISYFKQSEKGNWEKL